MNPISVVIPTRDTLVLTLRAVQSVRESGAALREIVVVDDGGSDGTAAALARFDPPVTVLRNAASQGFTRAANRGASATSGDILLFLNSDTEVEIGALDALDAAFADDATLGIAGAALHYPNGAAQWSSGPRPTLAWLFAMASGAGAARHRLPGISRTPRATPAGATRVAWVSGAAMAVRRSVWQALGPFDERFFFYAQDLDLCLRAGEAGWTVALLPQVRVLHHHGATIARGAGAELRQDPQLLWRDLLAWAEKAHGRRHAARAAAVLRAGGRCRLVARALAAPLQSASRRRELAADSRRYRAAILATREPPSAR